MYSVLRQSLLIFLYLSSLVSKLFLLTHITKKKNFCLKLNYSIFPQSFIINVELHLVFWTPLLTISLSFKKIRKAYSAKKKENMYFYVI